MPTVARGRFDSIEGKVVIYLARKVTGPHLVRKSGRHRGLLGKLYDTEAYIDQPIESTRPKG